MLFYTLVILNKKYREDEELQPGENQIVSLLFNVQSDKKSSFKVFKVAAPKTISLNDFDEVICGFKSCV